MLKTGKRWQKISQGGKSSCEELKYGESNLKTSTSKTEFTLGSEQFSVSTFLRRLLKRLFCPKPDLLVIWDLMTANYRRLILRSFHSDHVVFHVNFMTNCLGQLIVWESIWELILTPKIFACYICDRACKDAAALRSHMRASGIHFGVEEIAYIK